ncbi:hypothetical protein BB558_001138, partial [Smittium angustum]
MFESPNEIIKTINENHFKANSDWFKGFSVFSPLTINANERFNGTFRTRMINESKDFNNPNFDDLQSQSNFENTEISQESSESGDANDDSNYCYYMSGK